MGHSWDLSRCSVCSIVWRIIARFNLFGCEPAGLEPKRAKLDGAAVQLGPPSRRHIRH